MSTTLLNQQTKKKKIFRSVEAELEWAEKQFASTPEMLKNAVRLKDFKI